MRTRTRDTMLTAVLAAAFLLPAAIAAAGLSAGDPGFDDARERLADLFASDEIDRIDFQAMTFDAAMGRIYVTVDGVLANVGDRFADPEDAVRYARAVIEAFNRHRPRGLTTTFEEGADFAITDEAAAVTLGEMLGESTRLVREHTGPDASPERIRAAATSLFRSVVLEPDGGMSYVEQYREHVGRVAGMPAAERGAFLEAR